MDTVVDCLGFRDPDASSFHLGVHEEIMGALWRRHEAAAKTILVRVMAALREAQRRQQEQYRVAFYCKSGKHRSIAIGELVMQCMIVVEKLKVSNSPLCSYFWRLRGCTRDPSLCMACWGPPSHAKAQILDMATEWWQILTWGRR